MSLRNDQQLVSQINTVNILTTETTRGGGKKTRTELHLRILNHTRKVDVRLEITVTGSADLFKFKFSIPLQNLKGILTNTAPSIYNKPILFLSPTPIIHTHTLR